MDEPERRPGTTGRDLLVLAYERVPKAYRKFARAIAAADPELGAAFASMMMNPDDEILRTIPTAEDITPDEAAGERLMVGDELLPPGTVGRRTDSLDAAWAEAEAALPEGWELTGAQWVGPTTDYVGEPKPQPGEDWRADADALGLDDDDDAEGVCFGRGPTPAAALRALAAKLRDR